MKKVKAQKGITLIALIITIVVLLILAAVTISAIQGDGIIKHAKDAATQYKESQELEELSLYLLNWKMMSEEEKTTLFNYLETKYPGKVQENEDGSIMVTMESGNVYKIAADGDIELQPDSVEKLQEKYEFSYYSTLSGAVADVNSDTIGENADVDKEEAVAGIYTDDEGGKVVVLMQDTTESARVTLSTNMTINLGGNLLTVDGGETNVVGIDSTANHTDTITIDGRLTGSGITIESTGNAAIFQTRTNTFNINGGTYNVSSDDGRSVGVNNKGTLNLNNCTIFADSKYGDAESEEVSKVSIGVVNVGGTATINSCYIYGNNSGLQTQDGAKTYINGGIFESPRHGGIYFAHGSTGEAYVSGATIACVDYKGKYEDFEDTSKSYQLGGFYVGGSRENFSSNMKVYLDRCNIIGGVSAFVLRGTSNEQNNEVYISNSTIGSNTIRIDNDTHKLFIGKGCNFNADNTTLPSVVTITEDVYTKK